MDVIAIRNSECKRCCLLSRMYWSAPVLLYGVLSTEKYPVPVHSTVGSHISSTVHVRQPLAAAHVHFHANPSSHSVAAGTHSNRRSTFLVHDLT